jgi:hypothetical protein
MMHETLIQFPGGAMYWAGETAVAAPRIDLASSDRPSFACYVTPEPAGGYAGSYDGAVNWHTFPSFKFVRYHNSGYDIGHLQP